MAKAADTNEVMGVIITHPQKALWPAAGDKKPVSKIELARYFEAAGPLMFPHIERRPVSLVRAPDGIDGQTFFQRHAMQGTSELLHLVTVSGDSKPYLEIDSLDFLDIAFAIDKTFGIKLPLEQWTQEVNDGKATTEQYFVLQNLSEQIDKLIAAKSA